MPTATSSLSCCYDDNSGTTLLLKLAPNSSAGTALLFVGKLGRDDRPTDAG